METFKVYYEEFRVRSRDLVDKVRELVHESNIRRIIIKDEHGNTFMEIPLSVATLGALFAPLLAAIGAIAALVADFTIVLERIEEDKTAPPAHPATPPPAEAAQTTPPSGPGAAGPVNWLAVMLLVLTPAFAQDVPLLAGVARVEITPTQFGPMYGYTNRRCGPGTAVHDPLFAKALVLQTGETRMAIVTLDLGSMVSERLRDEARSKLHIPTLLLAASHTHSGPLFLAGSATPASSFLAEVEGKILSVIEEAAGRMFPARLSVTSGSLQLGYNRLLPRPGGRSRALFDNLERIPYGPVDPEFVLLRVTDESGQARALLVHYATHAVVLGPSNCKYSADYPGAMQARIEKEMQGVQCMFVQGGAGDINPLFMARSGKEDEDFAVVKKMGETLAGEVVTLAKAMPAATPNRFPIRTESEILQFSDRWEPEKKIQVGITTVLLNGDIAIAAMPGEPLHRLQTEWKRRAEVAHPLFYGYTYSSGGEWPGYIPDLRSAAHGGYGADASTRMAIGAGESLVERHLVHLYKMLGMWRDKPGQN